MGDYLMLWREEGPIDLESALNAYRRFSSEGNSRPGTKTEGTVEEFLRELNQVFPESGDEDSPWAQTPHSCGDDYVMLEVVPSRLPKVMNVAIPLAQQVGMTAFVPRTKELYSPDDTYMPELLLPSDAEIETIVGKLARSPQTLQPADSVLDMVVGEMSAKSSNAIQDVVAQGIEEMGFKRIRPQVFGRDVETCQHLVFPHLRGSLGGDVTLSVSVGIRFEAAERIRAAADMPEMNWESNSTHPTIGFPLSQLTPELPTQWRVRSMEEAKRTGVRVVEGIREYAEPYFRKYSDPDVVLDALVKNEEEARWLGYDSFSNSSYKRALSTLALCAARGDGQQLVEVIAMMRGVVEEDGRTSVRGFERFVDGLRSVGDLG